MLFLDLAVPFEILFNICSVSCIILIEPKFLVFPNLFPVFGIAKTVIVILLTSSYSLYCMFMYAPLVLYIVIEYYKSLNISVQWLDRIWADAQVPH